MFAQILKTHQDAEKWRAEQGLRLVSSSRHSFIKVYQGGKSMAGFLDLMNREAQQNTPGAKELLRKIAAHRHPLYLEMHEYVFLFRDNHDRMADRIKHFTEILGGKQQVLRKKDYDLGLKNEMARQKAYVDAEWTREILETLRRTRTGNWLLNKMEKAGMHPITVLYASLDGLDGQSDTLRGQVFLDDKIRDPEKAAVVLFHEFFHQLFGKAIFGITPEEDGEKLLSLMAMRNDYQRIEEVYAYYIDQRVAQEFGMVDKNHPLSAPGKARHLILVELFDRITPVYGGRYSFGDHEGIFAWEAMEHFLSDLPKIGIEQAALQPTRRNRRRRAPTSEAQ